MWRGVLFGLVLLVLSVASIAHAAEVSANATQETNRSGFVARATTCCADAGINGCDSGTDQCSANWTRYYDCRGASQIAALLSSASALAGGTTAVVYNCANGFDPTLSPANAANTPRFCQDITTRFAGGALSETAPDLSPQPWAGAQWLAAVFTCTTNCEAASFFFTCQWAR